LEVVAPRAENIGSRRMLIRVRQAGSTPLERKRLKAAAFHEVLRVNCENEPPRPSMRLSNARELPSIAARLHVEPRKLRCLV
jgi:hypothetical protein